MADKPKRETLTPRGEKKKTPIPEDQPISKPKVKNNVNSNDT